MKTFVLTISRQFPQTHKRKGEVTGFIPAILNDRKIHTIRSNFDLWEKRIAKINGGEAVLSVRVWEGKPYRSKQRQVLVYEAVGIEKLRFYEDRKFLPYVVSGECFTTPDTWRISKNDGLSFDDFEEWFKDYDRTKPMAIIHFTNFRYL